MRGIDPKKAECLLVAVREGTIRGAAEKLGVEPSTISRQIGQLEDELMIKLVERSRIGIQLTDAGQLLIEYLTKQYGELEVLRSEFDALQGMQRGQISIAVGEGFVADLFSKSVRTFAEKYPGISFSMDIGSSDKVADDVISDKAHLGLAYNSMNDRKLRKIAQVRQPLMLLAGKESAFSDLVEPVQIDDLSGLPCAIMNPGFGVGVVLGDVEARYGIRLRATVRTSSIAVLKNYVREGLGVTFLPKFVVVREMLDDQIVAKKLAPSDFQLGEAHLIVRQGRRLPEAVKIFNTHLIKTMAAFSEA